MIPARETCSRAPNGQDVGGWAGSASSFASRRLMCELTVSPHAQSRGPTHDLRSNPRVAPAFSRIVTIVCRPDWQLCDPREPTTAHSGIGAQSARLRCRQMWRLLSSLLDESVRAKSGGPLVGIQREILIRSRSPRELRSVHLALSHQAQLKAGHDPPRFARDRLAARTAHRPDGADQLFRDGDWYRLRCVPYSLPVHDAIV